MTVSEVSLRGDTLPPSPDLRIELRCFVPVGHAVVTNNADPAVARLAKVWTCTWSPPLHRFGVSPGRQQ
jgi:hypothetical protein